MRLHRVPWRTFQRATSLTELVQLARSGVYGRLTIARDATVKYCEPLVIVGDTPTAEGFVPAFLGQKWYWAPEIDLLALPSCTFVTQHSLPIFKNLVCDELDYGSDVQSLPGTFDKAAGALVLNGDLEVQVRQARWGPDTALLVHPRFHRNYTHWHTEGLAQLDAVRAIGSAVGAVAVPPLTGFKRASFDLWGDVGAPVFELDAPVFRFALAFMLTHSVFRTWLHPASASALNRLRAAAHGRLGSDTVGRRPVYLSRQDSKFRPLTNEAQVCEALAARGFEIVVASELTFEEQVAAFSRASIIVSPHGSGLTNMVYAQPGTPVIELRPMHARGRSPFYDRSYWILATLLRQPYGALIVENRPDTDEWTVDINWLERNLENIGVSQSAS